MSKRHVLSLFDGHSGLQLALKRAGIKIDNYYASEINEKSIAMTKKHFPKTIQLGDVRNIPPHNFPEIWLLSAGSPCQDLSIIGRRHGLKTIKGKEITSLKEYMDLRKKGHKFHGQSYLFWEFIRLVKELKPKYFFLENVKMERKWMYVISKELGVLPIRINSSLVSAQNRDRYYWTNIQGTSVPEDKKIHLSDVIPNAVAGAGKRGVMNKSTGKYDQKLTVRPDRKANCLVTTLGNTGLIKMRGGQIRRLTVNEAEKLQTLPVNYTYVKGVSDTDRIHSIGNGWTINVVSHLLKPLKKNLVKSRL